MLNLLFNSRCDRFYKNQKILMYNIAVITKVGSKAAETMQKLEIALEKKFKVKESREIGQRDLAYPIDKKEAGFYFWIDLDIDKQDLDQVKRELEKFKLLRFLITRKPVIIEEKKPKRAIKAKAKVDVKPKTISVVDKPVKLVASSTKEKQETAKKKAASDKKRMADLDKKLEEIL